MQVKKLIRLLQELPPETKVTVWHDSDVHELHSIGTIDYAPEIQSAMLCVVNSLEHINGEGEAKAIDAARGQ